MEPKRSLRSAALFGRFAFALSATPGILTWALRPILTLAAAVLLAFGGSLTGSFHLDDYSLLNNPLMTGAAGFGRIWTLSLTRPLTNVTFWFNYQLHATQPLGYHVVNLLVHCAAVLLLFAALRLLINQTAAFWAAAIFAVHPAQSETVAYVFARSGELSAAFCLAALYFWVHGRRVWTLVLFALALLCKEDCVTFPLFLLLLERWRNRPQAESLRSLAAMFALALAAGARAYWATAITPKSGAGFTAGVSVSQYFFSQGPAILRYIRLIIAPWGFTIEPSLNLSPQYVLSSWTLLLATAAALVYFYRKQRQWAFWTIIGFVLLLPSSSIFPAADLTADRRLYLPMVAFSAALGTMAATLPRAAPYAVVIVCAVLSIFRMNVWSTEESLWREAVERSPTHVRPLLQLSRVVPAPEAVTLLAKAKTLAPKNGDVSTELGRVWLTSGRYDLALPEFGRALALNPNDPNALNNRGTALLALHQDKAAQLDFERALRIDPCLDATRKNLQALSSAPMPTCTVTAK